MIYLVVNVLSTTIRFKTPMLRSDFCDYSDACIYVKGTINLVAGANKNMPKKDVALENNAPFMSSI